MCVGKSIHIYIYIYIYIQDVSMVRLIYIQGVSLITCAQTYETSPLRVNLRATSRTEKF